MKLDTAAQLARPAATKVIANAIFAVFAAAVAPFPGAPQEIVLVAARPISAPDFVARVGALATRPVGADCSV